MYFFKVQYVRKSHLSHPTISTHRSFQYLIISFAASQTSTLATMEMEKIIKRCNEALDAVSAKIPGLVWKHCKGVAIITVSQTGFGISVSEGDGVVIKQNDDGTWGPPSALVFSGFAAGAIFGQATKQIFLLPMTEHGLKMLSGQRLAELGLQMGFAAGPYGREAKMGAAIGGSGADITYSYTFEKGAMLDIGYNNCGIDAENEVNKNFYGVDKKVMDIVMTPGTVDIPKGKGVEEMHEKLAQLSKK
jgi:lipid-binding SYLF domain-containing protein